MIDRLGMRGAGRKKGHIRRFEAKNGKYDNKYGHQTPYCEEFPWPHELFLSPVVAAGRLNVSHRPYQPTRRFHLLPGVSTDKTLR